SRRRSSTPSRAARRATPARSAGMRACARAGASSTSSTRSAAGPGSPPGTPSPPPSPGSGAVGSLRAPPPPAQLPRPPTPRPAAVEKTGAHIAVDKARIDFAWPESIAPLLPLLRDEAQALVDADHPIVSAFSDEPAQRRYWEIAGFARVPCGGTHLRRTSEIG